MKKLEHFHKKHKKIYALFLLLAVLTIGSAFFVFSNPQKAKKQEPTVQNIENKSETLGNEQEATNETKKTEPNGSEKPVENVFSAKQENQKTQADVKIDAQNIPSTTTKNESAQKKTNVNTESAKSDSKSNIELVSATLKVSGKNYSIEIPKGATVLDLMSAAKAKGYMTFESKNFGGDLGYFIESINGVASGETKNYYWIYYINGAKANVGISNYTIQQNDIITWNYEKSTP